MAATAVPVASSLIAPEIAAAVGTTALGSTLASTGASWLLPAITGAGMGGIGSLLTGQDPLQGALLGGLGGGLGSSFGGIGGLGSLFGGGEDMSNETISPNLKKADPSLSNPVSSGSQPSTFSKMLPYAGLGLAAVGADRLMAPKQVGPAMEDSNKDYAKVKPMERQYQDVDPQSYFTTGGNRSYFDSVSPRPIYYAANGGRVKYASGGSSSASSSNIPQMKRPSRYIKGIGDGQSDDIDAKLSNGEFVFSAPVVSALGRGSNDAGAKKLDKMQKDIMRKNYKGGKAPKSMGLGGYVH